MTVLQRPPKEPTGTYTDGYDAGARDATERKPRAWKRPLRSRASFFRHGYTDGYDDHRAVSA